MPRAERPFARSTLGPARHRPIFSAVGLGVLVSLLGGLTGAHLALSSAGSGQEPVAAGAARVTLAIAEPAIDDAGPNAVLNYARDDGPLDEAALARLYEEPFTETPPPIVPVRPAARVAAKLHLAALPVPRPRPSVRPA